MNGQHLISRRRAIQVGAAASTLPLVHMRTAHAAGKLSLAFADSWVPATNARMRKNVAEWAAKNKVDVSLDLLNYGASNTKLYITQSEEALAGTGHDVMAFPAWRVQQYHQHLEPVDDVVEGLIKQYGKVDPTSEYLGKVGGHWMAVPDITETELEPSLARISMFKNWGYDVREWYPNHPGNAKTAEAWTYDLMLKLAPEAKKAGTPFGLGLGMTTDSVFWTGALLEAYGGVLVDEKGNMQLRSDAVQEVLEYLMRLYPHLPADTSAYDDASNNKVLIAGRSALIFNPPSTWWVARRDAIHVAEDCWQFPNPSGPKGRYVPYFPFFLGVWSFSQNKTAAKELITWLQQREQVESICDTSAGYDIPPFLSMRDFDIWSRVEPPRGVVYNYPIRPWHDAKSSIAGFPAPPHIATQLFNNATFNVMAVKVAKNKQPMKDVLNWAENEINGYINM